MNRLKVAAMAVLCTAHAGCVTTNEVPLSAEPAVVNVVEEPESGEEEMLRKSYEELKAENRSLKRENRKLRRELIRQRGDEPLIDLSKVRERKGVVGEEKNGIATDDGGFWLTDGTSRRHNSKCRYYKLGRGRPCMKGEGEPCKRCGG